MIAKIEKSKLGKLVMFLLTDGSVSISEDGKFEISFTNHNFVLVSSFISLFNSLFGKHNFQLRILPSGQFRIAVFSKEIVNFLLTLSPSSRKKRCESFPSCPLLRGKENAPCIKCDPVIVNGENFPPVHVPEFIFKLSLPEICEVLRVLTSTEGCITLQVRSHPLKIEREVTVGCRHPVLIKEFKELFSLVGLHFHLRQDRLFISSRSSLELFKERVGFINGTVVARKNSMWFGVEKNRLLQIALDSFKIKPRQLKLLSRESVLELLRGRLFACH